MTGLHAQSLKEVQKILDFPELKIVKPSDTRWLAHERCVKAVKSSYSAIITALDYIFTALDHIYSESHKPEALGIKKSYLQEINNCSYLSARLCSPTSRKA